MKTVKRFINAVLFMAVISLIGISHANPHKYRTARLKNDAQNFYWGRGVKRDYVRALKLYEAAASLGDPQASNITGGMYYTGKGALPDMFKAFHYLDYASRYGGTTPDATIALAGLYLQGEVVPQNYSRAFELYTEAAGQGNARAQLELGFLYYTGQGVTQDYSKAHDWFQEAALNNYNMAQYNLGISWYTGKNGFNRSSLIDAYAWINLAASNYFVDAYPVRDYLKISLTQDELEQARQKSEYIYDLIRQRKLAALSSP